MIVYLMRHGEATSESNSERHLTECGRSQVENVLKVAKQMGITVSAIASSPLARAKQTAEIAKGVFNVDFTITNSLETEGSPEEVYEELSKHGEESKILLISHQPLVSKLLSDMVGAERVNFSPGTLAMVSGIPKTGGSTLVLLIPSYVPNS